MKIIKEEQLELLQEQWAEKNLCHLCGSDDIANDDFGSPDEIRCSSCQNEE